MGDKELESALGTGQIRGKGEALEAAPTRGVLTAEEAVTLEATEEADIL